MVLLTTSHRRSCHPSYGYGGFAPGSLCVVPEISARYNAYSSYVAVLPSIYFSHPFITLSRHSPKSLALARTHHTHRCEHWLRFLFVRSAPFFLWHTSSYVLIVSHHHLIAFVFILYENVSKYPSDMYINQCCNRDLRFSCRINSEHWQTPAERMERWAWAGGARQRWNHPAFVLLDGAMNKLFSTSYFQGTARNFNETHFDP